MQVFVDVVFEPASDVSEMLGKIDSRIKSFDKEVGVELLGVDEGQVAVQFVSGGDGLDIVESVMKMLSDEKCEFVRGYAAGDEGSWCGLYWLEGGEVKYYIFTPEWFEALDEGDEDDEGASYLDDNIKAAREVGVADYLMNAYRQWSSGVRRFRKQQDYLGGVETVIEDGENGFGLEF